MGVKTGNKKYFRALYGFDKKNDLNTTFDYRLINTIEPEGRELLTNIVRIEKDNGFHERSRFFEHWLYFRDATNWKRCTKSGLAFTEHYSVFEGNISEPIYLTAKTPKGRDYENPKHFLICQSLDNWRALVIDLFKDFYPAKKEVLGAIIKEHQYFEPIKKGA